MRKNRAPELDEKVVFEAQLAYLIMCFEEKFGVCVDEIKFNRAANGKLWSVDAILSKVKEEEE